MTFEKVLQAMRKGKKARRKAWYDSDYIKLMKSGVSNDYDIFYIQEDGKVSYVQIPYFTVKVEDWVADDWEIVGEEQSKPKNYLSEAMSQSADKIMECVQKQMTQALEEVLERQDEEIAQKAIEETEKIFKAIHPETLFDVIDGEYEKIKVRGIRELAEGRGFHGDYNLSSETAAKALTILFADICDNQQQQINDLQTQIKNLNKRMDRCNID